MEENKKKTIAEPAPSTVTKKLDPKAQLADLFKENPLLAKTTLSEELSDLDQKLVSVQLKQKEWILASVVARKELEKYEKQSQALTDDLSESIRVEKYNEAESIQQKVNMIDEGIKKAKDQLAKVNELISSNEQKKISTRKRKAELLSFSLKEFKNWLKQEENLIKEFEAGMNMTIEDELKIIEGEKESLGSLNEKLNEDRKQFEQKVKELEDTVSSVCEKWIKDREVADSEIKIVDGEIEELEKKINEKREEKNKKLEARATIQHEIDSVKESYKPQQSEIDELSRKVKETDVRIEETSHKIDQQKSNVENAEEKRNKTVETRRNLVSQIAEAVMTSEQTYEKLQSELKSRETLLDNLDILEKNLYNTGLKLKNTETKREFYQGKAVKNDVQLADCSNQIMNCKVVLTNLEEDKKSFASAKKFRVILPSIAILNQVNYRKHQKHQATSKQFRQNWKESRKNSSRPRSRSRNGTKKSQILIMI